MVHQARQGQCLQLLLHFKRAALLVKRRSAATDGVGMGSWCTVEAHQVHRRVRR